MQGVARTDKYIMKGPVLAKKRVSGFLLTLCKHSGDRLLFFPSYGQWPNSNAGLLEHDNTAALQVGFNRGEIGDKKGKLFFRPPLGSAPEENDRWLAFIAEGE